MEEVTLTEPETRFYGELFQCCDVENAGKVPMLKATELFRSADIANETVIEITALAGIPSTALHISRAQFYSCLKLIAAHQAAMPLRQELIAATMPLPLPHFSWKEAATTGCENGLGALPPPPPTDRRNSLRRNSQQQQQQQQQLEQLQDTSDVPSTDSEVEQNESSCGGDFDELAGAAHDVGAVVSSSSSSRETQRRRGAGNGGSPEAWSTNSDSPTPTNSVAERPWAQDTLWQGLLGDEHRQLLGTEEESSDRHSSDEDDNENELITIYQITAEQREYYNKQFRAVQRDPHGLLSGQAARVFFEKSRIPVEELRHIWQLCDVTRDGALSLSEFTAAMHLVVLRRNNIPLPSSLPHCLHPQVLAAAATATATSTTSSSSSLTATHIPQEPPEADLLHLNDDDDDEHTDNTIISSSQANKSRAVAANNEKNIMNLSSISTSSQVSNSSGSRREVTTTTPPSLKNRSISNSPNVEKTSTTTSAATSGGAATAGAATAAAAATNDSSQWTKFSESPTTTTGQVVGATSTVAAAANTNATISSPGLKPALFDMKRTAQDVGSNPQILHPVPLRVTPIGTAIAATGEQANAQAVAANDMDGVVVLREESPKAAATIAAATATAATTTTNNQTSTTHRDRDRDSMQSSDLRAIQRPQAKKLPAKNIGALPPPPQREPSIGSLGVNEPPEPQTVTALPMGYAKKEPPPLPPPRPHRHTRSSSLDLNKFKMGTAAAQQPEITAQASFDMQTSTGFADFTHFANEDATVLDASSSSANATVAASIAEQQQHSLPPVPPPPAFVPPTRISLQQTQQRISAFEVYRKPQTPAPLTSTSTSTVAAQLPNAETFDKRVSAISDSLRHVSFKQNQTSTTELLQRLREQNNSLLHLCNDLSDELLSVQTRKEEMRLKLETLAAAGGAAAIEAAADSSMMAPMTANVTGGSAGSSGGHTNV
ncbi:ralBP1-associated Eps domain-containing protein 2 isoform X1 [Drosophila sulfurigaster albostrigata]|uniref:ralBP1-associated Eps domain-containing protein 2 isoform X1 n=1 Tax=Drosophila sulfurigaster albostrigata TaxID=89887 RepID=UPI002D2186D7|nr:ralBP1-associated Eps domain-containing protein 2 isoform X1 [Drosophila sulfurigaster albostrigata]